MASINWDEAPEGATHWETKESGYAASWMKKTPEGSWFYQKPSDSMWRFYKKAGGIGSIRESQMIPRPSVVSEQKLTTVVELVEQFTERMDITLGKMVANYSRSFAHEALKVYKKEKTVTELDKLKSVFEQAAYVAGEVDVDAGVRAIYDTFLSNK